MFQIDIVILEVLDIYRGKAIDDDATKATSNHALPQTTTPINLRAAMHNQGMPTEAIALTGTTTHDNHSHAGIAN